MAKIGCLSPQEIIQCDYESVSEPIAISFPGLSHMYCDILGKKSKHKANVLLDEVLFLNLIITTSV